MIKSSYQVKIKMFEGPFDLLFHLIEQEKINIYDIPVAQITEQYLEYINKAQMMDLELSSEFLLMAATLLKIKSKMLLPKQPRAQEDNEEDTREQLIERLIEYRLFKRVAALLRIKAKEQDGLYMRKVGSLSDYLPKVSFIPGDLTLEALQNAMKIVLIRKTVVEQQSAENHNILKDRFSVRKRIMMLSRLLHKNKKTSFNLLLHNTRTKSEKIITLLALLEMVRVKKAVIIQEEMFGDIIIFNPQYYKMIC